MQTHCSTTFDPAIVWQHLRFDELNRMPRNLRPDEAREIVQLAKLIGERCEPPIIDDDPHPDGAPQPPIYYERGTR